MKVLCVEDDEKDSILLSRMLHHPSIAAQMVCAERLSEAQERLTQETFDVILLDLSLPDAKGINTVKRMRAAALDIPIIVLTGLMDAELGVQCVQAGAQDYLVKGKISETLLARVMAYAIERQRVLARTIELAEARDIALESARLKAEFMSSMSHEIRTPLNAVIGMTELLLASELSTQQQKYAKVAHNASEALLRIVNDILDFAKMESGNLMLEKEDLNFRWTMDEAIELLAHQATAKGITLHSNIAPDLPVALNGDGGRLQQVLTNLVGNAVKFTDHGEVRVEARKKAETDQQVMIEFRVSDTGTGLSEQDKRKLFQPFSQADHSIRRKFGGTGLGLAISKKLVELMGGQIGVESALGQGSTFWFTLPFIKSSPQAHAILAEAQETALFSAAQLAQNIQILVADDNEFNRLLAQEQLLKLGYKVETVANGLQALQALEQNHFPLVLMDCQMPEMDGYQATEALRKKEAGGATRTTVIAMTANVMQVDYQRGVASGMDDYLAKPVKIGPLKRMLERWLTGGEKARETETIPTPMPSTPVAEEHHGVSLQMLDDVTNGDQDMLKRLKTAFCKQSIELLQNLDRAIADAAAPEIKRLAHCLAGSSVCIGAERMVRPLREIETAAETGQLDNVRTLFQQAQTEFERIKNFMSEPTTNASSFPPIHQN